MSEVFLDDARNLRKRVKKSSVDVTVTSPPYFDMKDYGHSGQIGFGQTYDNYLADLRKIFKDVYHVTKETGSLWVVIDSFKRDGAVVTLPFDFAR
jgi:DNA modification methylase